MKTFLLLASSAILLCNMSCVTKKKYLESEQARLEVLARSKQLTGELNIARTTNEHLNRQVSDLQRDTARLARSIQTYQQLLSGNISSQEKLTEQLNKKLLELSDREATINELQRMIASQKEKVQALLNSVKNALLGFDSDELTVREEDGKVYVAMSDKLLFASGSATVDTRGKEALAKLAEVLNKQTNIDVSIEGHTDSKPIHNNRFADNWDLSVIRATSVTRILTKEYGVSPLQILPCGRGEYMPVADNETIEGRAQNRRTEIIMTPRLDELYRMLQQETVTPNHDDQ